LPLAALQRSLAGDPALLQQELVAFFAIIDREVRLRLRVFQCAAVFSAATLGNGVLPGRVSSALNALLDFLRLI
jgi:hypothetical protein